MEVDTTKIVKMKTFRIKYEFTLNRIYKLSGIYIYIYIYALYHFLIFVQEQKRNTYSSRIPISDFSLLYFDRKQTKKGIDSKQSII